MSVEYYLACHDHKDKVWTCSDGISGPMNQCDWSLAGFVVTHRNCQLSVIDEHNEDCDDYTKWDEEDWQSLLTYDY